MEHGGYNEGHSYYSSILNSQNWAYIYLDNKNEIKHYINELIYGEKTKNFISNHFDREPTYLELVP